MTASPQFEAWYVLRHLSNRAFAVRDALRAAGIEGFLPTYSVETRWTDRTRLTTLPLFAGYIFARFDPAHASRILRTRGVFQILSINQVPLSIPDDEIAQLRDVVEHPAPAARCPYVAGAQVTVTQGPFAGTASAIARIKGGTLLTLLVPIFGRETPVEVDAADVRLIAE